MEGDTLVNGRAIAATEIFKRNGILRFLAPKTDVTVENTAWFGGKTKVTTSAIHHKGVKHTETRYIDINQKPVRIGNPLFGGVIIKRVAPKR